MRVKNDKIRSKILKVARKEFLDKGFTEASLRNIAKLAYKTTGTIYIYFKNKNEIFSEIVRPAVAWFDNRYSITERATEDEIKKGLESIDVSYNTWLTNGYRLIVETTDKFRDELTLLFFKSSGSSYETYLDSIIERAMQRGIKVFRNLERTPGFKGEIISDFFIRNFATFNINIMQEMIKQKKSKKEMLALEHEFTSFIFSGWKSLVEL